jgi:hypothetical protein
MHMPAAQRKITPADLLPPAEFGPKRSELRAALLPRKTLRRVDVGPYCTFYFENFDTMLFQVQEMLHIERGGDAQIADELAAYNPLIPQGDELIATIMFEIDEANRRERELTRLGGVEDKFFIQIGSDKIRGVQESDVERTREDGKASSVHFAHFPFSAVHKQAFADSDEHVMLGVDHPNYSHLTVINAASRAELASDFA